MVIVFVMVSCFISRMQVFGLIRDPSADNNWKIKQTEARLVGGTVSDVPSITSSKLEAVGFC